MIYLEETPASEMRLAAHLRVTRDPASHAKRNWTHGGVRWVPAATIAIPNVVRSRDCVRWLSGGFPISGLREIGHVSRPRLQTLP